MYVEAQLNIELASESRTNWIGLGEGISRPTCGITYWRRHAFEGGQCVDKIEWSCHRPNCSNPHCVEDWIDIESRQIARSFDRWRMLDIQTIGAVPSYRDEFQIVVPGADRKAAASYAKSKGMRRGFTVVHRGGEGAPCPSSPHVHCVGMGYWSPEVRFVGGPFRSDLRGVDSKLLCAVLSRAVVPYSSLEKRRSHAAKFLTWFGETKKRLGFAVGPVPESDPVPAPPRTCPKCGRSIEKGDWEYSRDAQNWVSDRWMLGPRPIRYDRPSNWAEINDLETNGIRP